jgi:hypothetical protein
MSDSLNNFINKAGQSVSEKLSNSILGKSISVDGSENHSGNYIGPGNSDVNNRTQGVDLKENPNPSPGQFSPAKSFDGNPAGFTPIKYYRIPVKNSNPKEKTGLDRFRRNDEGSENSDVPKEEVKPISDYKIIIDEPGRSISKTDERFADNKNTYKNFNDPTGDFRFGLLDPTYSSNWPNDSIPISGINGLEKNDREAWDGSVGTKPWVKHQYWGGGEGTPYENEDPVYFGFEIEIDALNSPLLNGEALNFIKQFSAYEEVGSRENILYNFLWELSRYFKFNTDTVLSKSGTQSTPLGNLENRFETKLNKKFYLRKVEGLEKLIEANTSAAQSAFVKYKTDTIKLGFQEDTNLNTGTLTSLYKLLYWSRIKGKNIIPENLLRFDCKIIVSEARNLVRIKKIVEKFREPEPISQPPDTTSVSEILSNSPVESAALQQSRLNAVTAIFEKLEKEKKEKEDLDAKRAKTTSQLFFDVLKENVSRYVYNLYECQFFFNTVTHDAAIDLSQPPRFTADAASGNLYTIEFNYKFSDMKFERFVFNGGIYKSLNNGQNNPLVVPKDTNKAEVSAEGINRSATPVPDLKIGTISKFSFKPETKGILEKAKNNETRSRFAKAISGAADNLIDNVRTAGLNEAQRQLNNQFRLLNNTLDKVRNSFGVGRMSPPTNVYQGAQPGTFFFDVQNSLRNFAGDTLSGTIFGNNG